MLLIVTITSVLCLCFVSTGNYHHFRFFCERVCVCCSMAFMPETRNTFCGMWYLPYSQGSLNAKFTFKGTSPNNHFLHGWIGQWMLYNFVADIYHIKKFCSRLSSSAVRFYTENGRFAFLRPPLDGLGATYDFHLRLIEKRLVDFLLVLLKFFR